MNFIKKIFDGVQDDLTHLQFQKFSKGEFRDRALIEIKKTAKKYNIKTSAEFANELVIFMAEKLGSDKTNIKGVVVSTLDLDGKIDYVKKSNFQGVKKYAIDCEMSGNDILSLIKEMPKNFFALTFDVDTDKLKIKAKAPKSGKAGKEGEAKADFCSLKTSSLEFVKSFIFEVPEFVHARINHTYFIEEIIPPKDEEDFAKIRELALRKGRIVRKSIIDEKDVGQEFEFSA